MFYDILKIGASEYIYKQGEILRMTVNEGIAILKSLKIRHNELVALRDNNAFDKRYLKEKGDFVEKPTYDVKAIDRLIVKIAKAIRELDATIKKSNAITEINFIVDDAVFGSIE